VTYLGHPYVHKLRKPLWETVNKYFMWHEFGRLLLQWKRASVAIVKRSRPIMVVDKVDNPLVAGYETARNGPKGREFNVNVNSRVTVQDSTVLAIVQ